MDHLSLPGTEIERKIHRVLQTVVATLIYHTSAGNSSRFFKVVDPALISAQVSLKLREKAAL
jgi:hypothetical protein